MEQTRQADAAAEVEADLTVFRENAMANVEAASEAQVLGAIAATNGKPRAKPGSLAETTATTAVVASSKPK